MGKQEVTAFYEKKQSKISGIGGLVDGRPAVRLWKQPAKKNDRCYGE